MALTLMTGTAMAQNSISKQQIADSVTGYVTSMTQEQPTAASHDGATTVIRIIERDSRNINHIRWHHNLRIGIGTAGFWVDSLLDGWPFSQVDYDTNRSNLSDELFNARIYEGNERGVLGLHAEYSYALNHWLSIGGKGLVTGGWLTLYDSVTNRALARKYDLGVGILVNFRAEWLRRNNVQMYSSVGVGSSLRIRPNTVQAKMLWDFTFVGLSVGRKFYGYAEFGAGLEGFFRAGIGLRFN